MKVICKNCKDELNDAIFENNRLVVQSCNLCTTDKSNEIFLDYQNGKPFNFQEPQNNSRCKHCGEPIDYEIKENLIILDVCMSCAKRIASLDDLFYRESI